jgi:dihydrofolate synthase / folylpolyglutamate synthase
MNYPDSVQFLYSLGNEIKTAKLGLERIRALLEALGNPHRHGRFVHVAGTNGKGSVCAMVESGLRTAGKRTGLFTSPHLIEPVERIRIDGVPVPAEVFAAAFDRVHQAAEELIERGAIDLHPTYFETVTAMGFVLFEQQKTEVTVLEVGLGGRLDATNVVTPEICAITPIDFDHEAWLGKSLKAIAGEKAGILKPGIPAVIAAQHPEADATLSARALELSAPLVRTSEWQIDDLELTPQGSRFRLTRGATALDIRCPLAGEHQVENARTAAGVLDRLGIPAAAIEQGIGQARWPGRLEHVAGQPEIILDGAHNPAGARALRGYIERFYAGRKIWMIYGAMRDKAVAEMTGILFPAAAEVVATAPKQARAVRPEAIAELAEDGHVRIASTVAEALALVRREAAPQDVIFITGSLFLIGEAKSLI